MSDNPLLQPWNGPYGLPPFDRIQPEHFGPALETLITRHREELEALAAQSEPPSFENTCAALDRSGEGLDRVMYLIHNLWSSANNEALQALERDWMPRLAAHQAWVALHPGLFARLTQVHNDLQAGRLDLNPEQRRLVERQFKDFVLGGAKLSGADRDRAGALQEEMASLCTTFNQTLLAEEDAWRLALDAPEDRAGLPDFLLDAAAAIAARDGRPGWALNLSPSVVEPFLTFSPRRDLRQTVWTAYKARGTQPGRQTLPTALTLLERRAEWARLMGYPHYAAYAFADRMASGAEAVESLLTQVWEPAKALAEREQAEREALAAADGQSGPLEPWDWAFYTEKLRRQRYALDEAALKEFFPLSRMREALFDMAERLYGLEFKAVEGLPLYHPDVKLWEVRDRSRGRLELKGIFLSDDFARPGKRGGAWMSEFRGQSKNRREAPPYPIILNNNNLAPAAPGEEALLSFDEVRTLFHEFGHALHGLLSDVTYGRLAGTNVLTDFVELPSQIHENWAFAPELLRRHARHRRSGEPLAESVLARLKEAEHFNQGFKTVEYTACALIDLTLHTNPDPAGLDLEAVEAAEAQRLGLPRAVGWRHRLPQFRHLFASSGYAAGYYVYMWAEVLEADAFQAFVEKGDLFDPVLASEFKRWVLAAGDSLDPAEAFRRFRGRDPVVEPLLRARGLL